MGLAVFDASICDVIAVYRLYPGMGFGFWGLPIGAAA
jgi:hypothetical protein